MDRDEKCVEKIKELSEKEYREYHRKVHSIENDPNYIELAESVEKRQQVVPSRVEKQFKREGQKFYFKDGEKKLALEDKGNSLVAKTDDDRVILAITSIAAARGWSHMKVKGSKEFKRKVWLEGAAHGIKVDGYKPTEKDLAELKERSQTGLHKDHDSKKEQSKGNNQVKELSGELLRYGEAPLGFNKKAASSYFVQIKTPGGVKTIWGASLANGIHSSGAKEGDHISLKYQNKETAKIKEPKQRDGKEANRLLTAAEAVIGKKIKDPAMREAVQESFQKKMQEHIKSGQKLPQVQVYDRNAKPRQPQHSSRETVQTQQREREQERRIER